MIRRMRSLRRGGKGNKEVESDSHVMVCSGYGDLRKGLDLNRDEDLVTYLQKVMLAREKVATEERKNR